MKFLTGLLVLLTTTAYANAQCEKNLAQSQTEAVDADFEDKAFVGYLKSITVQNQKVLRCTDINKSTPSMTLNIGFERDRDNGSALSPRRPVMTHPAHVSPRLIATIFTNSSGPFTFSVGESKKDSNLIKLKGRIDGKLINSTLDLKNGLGGVTLSLENNLYFLNCVESVIDG